MIHVISFYYMVAISNAERCNYVRMPALHFVAYEAVMSLNLYCDFCDLSCYRSRNAESIAPCFTGLKFAGHDMVTWCEIVPQVTRVLEGRCLMMYIVCGNSSDALLPLVPVDPAGNLTEAIPVRHPEEHA